MFLVASTEAKKIWIFFSPLIFTLIKEQYLEVSSFFFRENDFQYMALVLFFFFSFLVGNKTKFWLAFSTLSLVNQDVYNISLF